MNSIVHNTFKRFQRGKMSRFFLFLALVLPLSIAGQTNTVDSVQHNFSLKSFFTRGKCILLFCIFFFQQALSLHAQNALHFDGTDDKVTVPGTGMPFGASARTFEMWVYREGTDQRGLAGFDPGLNTNGSTFVMDFTAQGYLHLRGWNVDPVLNNITMTPKITTGAWTHVAYTYDGTTIKGYINGTLVGSSVGTLNTGSTSLVIGNSTTWGFFMGKLDEFRVWNVTRTQAEIQANMNSELSTGTGLINVYHFNQGTAGGTNTSITTLTDSKGSNTGVLNNFALTGSTSNWVTGINLSSAISITTGSQTICFGTNVTFTATPVNTTTTPVYQWKKNNINVGSNSATYSDALLANNDIITCILTSESNLPVSNSLQMTVIAVPTVPSITGSATVEINATTTLANTTTGGVWSSSNTAIATVNASSGLVTGVINGSVTMSYAVTNACGTTTVTKALTVNPPTYCLTYKPEREGNHVFVHVSLLANGSAFNLGDGNLQFKYKSAVLTNPTIQSDALTATGKYGSISLTSPTPVGLPADELLASFNFEFTGTATGQGLLVGTTGTGTEIAVIRFDITDAATSPNIRTYDGTIVYNDSRTLPALLASTGGCAPYDFPLSTQFTYSATAYCKSVTPQSVTLTGTSGGTYSALPTGLSINATTGVITASTSTAGTYTVYYDIPSSGGGQASTVVTINALPTPAIIGLAATYCPSDVSAITMAGTPVGGSFTLDAAAITSLPAVLSAGTHTVTYTYTDANTCSATATQSVTIYVVPSIGTQPVVSTTLCAGFGTTLSVVATGQGLTYQWKKDGTNIGGATAASYAVTSATTDAASTSIYTVVVSGTCTPSVTSSNATVIINALPKITAQPTASTTLCAGAGTTLSVTATGTGVMYQWKKDGTDIGGATAASYAVTSTTADVASTSIYTVVVSGTCTPSVISSNSTVIINALPKITAQPTASTTLCAGNGTTLSVTATGTGLAYQWQKDGNNISGATAADYAVTSTTADVASTSTYTVVVSGTCTPPLTSANATVIINALPKITAQPVTSTTLCAGAGTTLSVTATGTGLSYQWKKGGTDISGATASTYAVTSTTTDVASTSIYTVVVSGTCTPPLTSSDATVIINALPTITAQPTALTTVCAGTAVSFSVSATGTGLTYQWKKDGNNIGAATSSTFAIASPIASDGATYTVAVGGTCTPTVTSTDVVLVVNTPPVITTQPATTSSVCVGSPTSISVVATGTALTYQWKKGGSNIFGATSASYPIPSAVTGNAGTYSVDISGTCPSPVTSGNSVLTVNSPLSITTQPIGTRTVCAGAAINLSVTVTGASLTYQWKKDGNNISGATSTTYSIPTSVENDQATYTVAVSGACSTTTLSSGSVVTVNSATNITTQPVASTTVCAGAAINLSIVATGRPLTYQWKKGGVDISGATSSTFAIATSVVGDAATYTVSIANSCAATVTSGNAVVVVNALPSITTQPTASTTLCAGAAISLSVTAAGTGLTYQWKKGGVNIGSATSSTYAITTSVVGDAGTYSVLVGGTCAPTVLSGDAVVVVNALPSIATQPTASTTLCAGAGVTLSVGATGTGVTYQWKKGGTDIVGATASTYAVMSTAADVASTSTYTVTVSGTCAPAVTSGNAVVTINALPSITTQPVTLTTLCAGATISLSVAATGTGLSYQWKKGSTDIGLATSSTYTITPSVVGDAGTYSVLVSGTCTPTILSGNAVVVVNALPSITTQPATSTTVCEGVPINLIVVAAGTAVTYQWKKGGTDISGANSSSFAIASTLASDAATYTVVVSGTCSPSVTSGNAVLVVHQLPSNIGGTPSVNATFTTALTNTVAGGTWSSSNTAIATVNATTGVVTGVLFGTATISYTVTNACGVTTVTKDVTVIRNTVQVSAKAFLQGPFSSSAGSMTDGLRSGGYIPTIEPYTGMSNFTQKGNGGGEMLDNANVTAITGNNAIVDWVFIELRDKLLPSTVVSTRSALIQRDGDIVDTDGTSPVTFKDVIAGDFYVAIRHRNHLGFRTADAQALTSTPLSLDFTNNSKALFGSTPLKLVGSVYVMFSGNGDSNGVVNAIDKNSVWLVQNGQFNYLRGDFDMNGVINAADLNGQWLGNNSRIQQLD